MITNTYLDKRSTTVTLAFSCWEKEKNNFDLDVILPEATKNEIVKLIKNIIGDTKDSLRTIKLIKNDCIDAIEKLNSFLREKNIDELKEWTSYKIPDGTSIDEIVKVVENNLAFSNNVLKSTQKVLNDFSNNVTIKLTITNNSDVYNSTFKNYELPYSKNILFNNNYISWEKGNISIGNLHEYMNNTMCLNYSYMLIEGDVLLYNPLEEENEFKNSSIINSLVYPKKELNMVVYII